MNTLGHFFVTGLPRTRTAWLANLLTSGGVVCAHEGLLQGVGKLVAAMKAGEIHGNADSSIPLHWEPLFDFFPNARWVVVERDAEEAFQSHAAFLTAAGLRVDAPRLRATHRQASAAMREMMRTVPHLAVPFHSLGELATVQRVWSHCLPTQPFDAQRGAMLQFFNVQQHVPAALAALSA